MPRPRPLAALAIGLASCIFDPHGRMDKADLRIVLSSVEGGAAKVTLSVRHIADPEIAFIRGAEPDGRTSIEVYFPTLPAGRYRLTARAFRAAAGDRLVVTRCARFQGEVDAAQSPQAKTFDMKVDAVDCATVDGGPVSLGGDARVPDAGPPPPDAAPQPDDGRARLDAGESQPDAEATDDAKVDKDMRHGPPPRDMRVTPRPDAEEDEQH